MYSEESNLFENNDGPGGGSSILTGEGWSTSGGGWIQEKTEAHGRDEQKEEQRHRQRRWSRQKCNLELAEGEREGTVRAFDRLREERQPEGTGEFGWTPARLEPAKVRRKSSRRLLGLLCLSQLLRLSAVSTDIYLHEKVAI